VKYNILYRLKYF